MPFSIDSTPASMRRLIRPARLRQTMKMPGKIDPAEPAEAISG
jgi:hypothetical protein